MTTKFPSPLLGYNNNVRHKGKVFHIQTEDSGVKYGHIITHLFMDGGRILKSVKTGYQEYVGNERMGDIVREMMKQQHKAMFIALRDGKFDAIVDGTAAASSATQSLVPKEPVAASAPAIAPVPEPTPAPPAALGRTQPGPSLPVLPGPGAEDAPATIRQPPELTLDMDALERAAAAAHASAPPLRPASELPPPPANLFRDRAASGKYRMTPVPPTPAPPAVSAKGPAKAPTPKPAQAQPPAGRKSQANMPAAGERRYAPTRPAAIFGARPQPNKSVFGEDLMSDKSLDEVILSYLAEDLDEKK